MCISTPVYDTNSHHIITKPSFTLSRPPLFVPRSELTSISCGRGSGSRYVDMLVQLDVPSSDLTDEQEGKKKKKQTDSLEFTNIHRDELNVLNDYIHQTLIPAMQMDADGSPGDDPSEGSSDDEDVAVAEVVGDDEDDEGSERKCRSVRAASKSARDINRAVMKSAHDDEDDDDSDDFEEEDASDTSCDDESVISADEESNGSSSEDEDFEEEEEMNDSDGSEYDQKSKKPRIE